MVPSSQVWWVAGSGVRKGGGWEHEAGGKAKLRRAGREMAEGERGMGKENREPDEGEGRKGGGGREGRRWCESKTGRCWTRSGEAGLDGKSGEGSSCAGPGREKENIHTT